MKKKLKIILMPDDDFKRHWNLLMILLLVYVATYVPYSICFTDISQADELTNE